VGLDDRDWYAERQKHVMERHYYDPRVFRGSREAWAQHKDARWPLRAPISCHAHSLLGLATWAVIHLALVALSLAPLVFIWLALSGVPPLVALAIALGFDIYFAIAVAKPKALTAVLIALAVLYTPLIWGGRVWAMLKQVLIWLSAVLCLAFGFAYAKAFILG